MLSHAMSWCDDYTAALILVVAVFADRRLFSEIYQWKVDHDVFESREVAAEAKANEAKRAQEEEGERQGLVRGCKRTPKTCFCRMVLARDAQIKKEAEEEQMKEKKNENGGDGDPKGEGV